MSDYEREEIIRQGLNDTYQKLFDLVNEDADMFWEIFDEFKGLQVNFPIRIYNADKVAHMVINEYDGVNGQELAQRYGFSKRWVNEVIRKNRIED